MSSILVIDDDSLVLRTIEIILTQRGHKVVSVTSGRAGVDLYKTTPFDLVITDMLMPEQMGTETIAQLRDIDCGVKILAISGGMGGEQGEAQSAAEAAGATSALRKPFDSDVFARQVETLCR